MKILAVDASWKYERDLGPDGKPVDRMNNGRGTRLLREALDGAHKEGDRIGLPIETSIIYLHEVIKEPYPGWHANIPEWLKETFEEMLDADAIVVGGQVGWYSRGSWVQTFMEYNTVTEYGPEVWQPHFPDRKFHEQRQLVDKLCGVIVTCNEDGAQAAGLSIWGALNDLGMDSAPRAVFYQNNNAKEGSEEQWQITHHRLVTKNMVDKFARLHGMDIQTDWELWPEERRESL